MTRFNAGNGQKPFHARPRRLLVRYCTVLAVWLERRVPQIHSLLGLMVRAAASSAKRILAAARELFFAQGFAKVSTDDLAQAASVSKATLYKHFNGMQGVLQAVVEAEVESFEQGVPTQVQTREEFIEALTTFGSNLLNFLNKAEIIRFSQLIFEQARSYPELAAEFYASAYGRTQEDLADLIRQGVEQGFLLTSLESTELAEQLLGLWEGFGFIRALLGLTARPFEDPDSWSRACVLTLLQGRGTGPQ